MFSHAVGSRIGAFFSAALVLFVAGCQIEPKPVRATAEPASTALDWDAYASEFLQWYFTSHPNDAVWAGRHEFDGQLPDWSAVGIKSVIERLHLERDRARSFGSERLDSTQRFEREVLLSKIDGDLFWLESAQWPFRSPAFYGWALDPNVYVAREYAPLAQRLQAYIAYARAIPVAAAQIRWNLRTPMPRTFIQIGHIRFGGLARFYEQDVPGIFSAVADQRLHDEFRLANAGAISLAFVGGPDQSP